MSISSRSHFAHFAKVEEERGVDGETLLPLPSPGYNCEIWGLRAWSGRRTAAWPLPAARPRRPHHPRDLTHWDRLASRLI